MEDIALNLPEPQTYGKWTKQTFNTLLVAFTCIFLAWYAQYHWKRRRLYKIAAQRKGPFALPLIGCAYNFIGSTELIYHKCLTLFGKYDSPAPIWIGQRLFFTISKPKDLEIVLNSPNALKKSDVYSYTECAVGHGLFTAPVPKWKKNRRIIMPTFNQKILDDFVVVFSEQSIILLDLLEKEVGRGNFNIFHNVSRCTLDIICETAMGTKVYAQTSDPDFVKWANKGMELVHTRIFNVLYHSDFLMKYTAMGKELLELTTKMREFTGSIVRGMRIAYQTRQLRKKTLPEAQIEEEPTKRKNFLQLLIELSETGEILTDQEMADEVNTFMVAGSDTTASVNSFVFIMLGMYPEVQEKVYEEVIEVLGPDKSVEYTDLKHFNYLERVIKETMRLFPVGPFIGRDITGDIELDRFTIPAGCSVAICVINLHRDPNVWPNPLKFDPDRFLPEEVAKRHPYSWLPYSGGPRNCVGLKYAMMAMKALITTVVRKYRFHADYKHVEDIKLKADLMLKPVDGYKVSVELRD